MQSAVGGKDGEKKVNDKFEVKDLSSNRPYFGRDMEASSGNVIIQTQSCLSRVSQPEDQTRPPPVEDVSQFRPLVTEEESADPVP